MEKGVVVIKLKYLMSYISYFRVVMLYVIIL